MDNASKALIMAGGILIAVMIIGIAMYIIGGAREFADAANNQSSLSAVQSFNKFYQAYETSITGINVLNVYNKHLDDREKGYDITVKVPSGLIEGLTAKEGTGAEFMNNTYKYFIDGYGSDGRINHISITN